MKLGDLAERIGATLEGCDPKTEIRGLATIDEAGPGEVAFVANKRYIARARESRASAVISRPDVVVAGGALRSDDPYAAFVRALDLFHRPLVPAPGVHSTASIAPDAKIGPNAAIGAFVVVGERAQIGADARIDAGVIIYPDALIGNQFVAFAGAIVREGVKIGDRVRLQAGAVIGGDGFGYLQDPERGVRSIPQTGTVILEDDVEIGANSTIDRATIGATRIRRGAKIDNLVMVAHGCEIVEYAFLAAQSGLAGSSKVGAGAQLGGQVGLAGHLTVGAGARLGAQAGVHGDVPAGATVSGTPSVEMRLFRRMVASWLRLPEALRRLRKLEKKVEELLGSRQ
jgi:UDP-3-O-[3-hydroxymyristoyl] glucosamine N-acyltransferase